MSHIYQPTDIVLAKVKGYPAWPAMVVPTELIPQHILRSKHQQSTKRKNTVDELEDDGEPIDEVKEEEEDDEELSNYIVYSSILKFRKFDGPCQQYCVKFFCDDSYIWVRPADLKPLNMEDCQKWLDKPRNKKLIPAYEMASKGSEGIDVWEFVEYGSAGKPDEEEYEEPYEEEEDLEEGDSGVEYENDSSDERQRPSRTSARQRKQRESQNKRATRSRRQIADIDDKTLDSDEEFLEPRKKRAKTKSNAKKKPLVVKYKFEDDEDWTLVGMGPQDLSIQETVSPFVSKLSQKKNMESHLETKLELVDRVHGVNKILFDILTSSEGRSQESFRDDCEVALDELIIALETKGAGDEFATVFQSSTELLSYFRLLFNMKGTELKNWGLWDQFQNSFSSIYGHEFIPDKEQWSTEKSWSRESEVSACALEEGQSFEGQDGPKSELKT